LSLQSRKGDKCLTAVAQSSTMVSGLGCHLSTFRTFSYSGRSQCFRRGNGS
jgi:hypothetical protein